LARIVKKRPLKREKPGKSGIWGWLRGLFGGRSDGGEKKPGKRGKPAWRPKRTKTGIPDV